MYSPHLNRAIQLFDLNRFQQCYEEASKVLQQDLQNEVAHYYMLASLIALDDLKKAEQIGLQAIQNHPNSEDLHYLLGVLYNELDQGAKARDHLEIAIQIDPQRSTFFYELARMHLGFGQLEKAIKMLEHSLHLDPNDDDALRLKSLVEQHKKSTKGQAHLSADEALKISPDDSSSHFVKGLACLRNRQFEEAESFLKTAAQLDPSNEVALSLWFESRIRNLTPWNKIINLLAGGNHNLIRPLLILAATTFIPNLIISDGKNIPMFGWLILIILLIPSLIYWMARPFLKFQFLNRKFNWKVFEIANRSLPIEALANLTILTTLLFWITEQGALFGISFVSTLGATGLAFLKYTESSYPVYKNPLKVSGQAIVYVLGITLTFYFLYLMDQG